MEKLKLFKKGELVDYQTLIEELVGPWLSTMKIYNGNWDRKTEINGRKVEKDRAYFLSDADYELILIKKNK